MPQGRSVTQLAPLLRGAVLMVIAVASLSTRTTASARPSAWAPPSRPVTTRGLVSSASPLDRLRARVHSHAVLASIRPTTPVRVDSIGSCGAWSTLWPDGRPVQTAEHAMIYDATRDRIVVFGGRAPNDYSAEVYTMSMSGTPTWVHATTTGGPPEARSAAAAIYDPSRDRMIVFGGYGAVSIFNDVWALDLGTMAWTQLAPSGASPAARLASVAIYDAPRDRMVMFGGSDGFASDFNDVWALSFAGTPAWTQVAPSGAPPAARTLPTAIFDGPRNRMIVFGGISVGAGNLYLNDVWSLSLTGTIAWTELAPSGSVPGQRFGHAALFDAPRNRMVMYGGFMDDGVAMPANQNDLWSLALTGTLKWTRLNPSGLDPTPAEAHAIVYDSVRQRLVTFGGFGALDRMWTVNLSGSAVWSEIIPPAQPPGRRTGHTIVWDAPRHRMIVFGGAGEDGTPTNDAWAFALTGTPAWTRLAPSTSGPMRAYQVAVIDSTRNRLVVFGGLDQNSTWSNEVWTLSLTGTPTWTHLNPSGTDPTPRIDAVMIYDPTRDRMVVHGGRNDGGGALNDVWALSLSGSGSWTHLTPGGEESPYDYQHSAVYDRPRDRMLLVPSSSFPPVVWSLTFAGGGTWSAIPTTGLDAAGYQATSLLDFARNRLLLLSPYDYGVYSLPLTGAASWSQVGSPSTAPDVRNQSAAILDRENDRVVVFAGQTLNTQQVVNSVAALTFPSNVYALNIGSSPAGYAEADVYQECYDGGTVVHLTAYPDQGFFLAGWSGDASGSANPLTLTMNGHKSVTPNFDQPPPVADSWRRLLANVGLSPFVYGPNPVMGDPIRHRVLSYGAVNDVPQIWAMPMVAGPTDWQFVATVAQEVGDVFSSNPRLSYDPVRDRMLRYAGNEVWGLNLTGAPTWSRVSPASGNTPGQRFFSSSIYDPVRNRLLVFGGRTDFTASLESYLNDVWALSLSGTPTWSQLAIVGTLPPPRSGHSMIYDPVRDRMIVFAGYYGATAMNDAWELQLGGTPEWRQVRVDAGTPPEPRGDVALMYDPIRDRMILFGGVNTDVSWFAPPPNPIFDDVWALSLRYGRMWSKLSPDGTLPGPQLGADAVFDPDNDRMVISDGFGLFNSRDLKTHALSFAGKYWLQVGVPQPEWGTIEVSPQADCYAPGTVVTLTAHPAPGKALGKWSGDVDTGVNPLQVTMDGNKVIVAALGLASNVGVEGATPRAFALERGTPNPFARTTRFGYALPRAARMDLVVYDAAGRRVRTLVAGDVAAGRHEAAWEGVDASGRAVRPGVYFVRMRAPGYERVERVLRIE